MATKARPAKRNLNLSEIDTTIATIVVENESDVEKDDDYDRIRLIIQEHSGRTQ